MIDSIGLQKTTLLDYPGKVAATVFTHGCPLRCPYCHNPELVGGPVPEYFIRKDDFTRFLDRRKNVLEGICITGGEPMVHQDLPELISLIRSRGLLVKLDTSGMFPDRLKKLLDAHLVDFVAMDIKTAFSHYDRVAGDGAKAARSVEILRKSSVDHEFRTTMAPGIVTEEDLTEIAGFLGPEDTWALAQFRPTVTLDPSFARTIPYPDDLLFQWCRDLTQKKRRCIVRGVLKNQENDRKKE